MMGKAHIAVGIASALVIAFPENVMQFALAVAGGAIGGIASDIDIKSNAHTKDARQSRIIAFIVAFLAIIAGCIYDTIVTLDYESAPLAEMGIGLLIVIPTAIAMRRSSHRGFSHSILAGVICTFGLLFINITFALAFLASFASHVLLDLMNKRGVRVFYPFSWKPCLGICVADKTGNNVALTIGFILDIFLISVFLISYFA